MNKNMEWMMKFVTPLSLLAIGSALLLITVSAAAEDDWPRALQALESKGLQIDDEFTAPDGLRGFVGQANGQQVAIYAAGDSDRVIIGQMIDGQGNNLTQRHIRDHAPQPDLEAAWERLESADWIREGSAEAERVVYVFTDPNCPYCSAFWQASRPYVGKQAQLRHIMVGVIRPDSTNKSAAILASDDPAAALARHERSAKRGGGGVQPLEPIPPSLRQDLQVHHQLMNEFGAQATPAIFFKDESGKVRHLMGMQSIQVIAEQIFQQPKQPVNDPSLERYDR